MCARRPGRQPPRARPSRPPRIRGTCRTPPASGPALPTMLYHTIPYYTLLYFSILNYNMHRGLRYFSPGEHETRRHESQESDTVQNQMLARANRGHRTNPSAQPGGTLHLHLCIGGCVSVGGQALGERGVGLWVRGDLMVRPIDRLPPKFARETPRGLDRQERLDGDVLDPIEHGVVVQT